MKIAFLGLGHMGLPMARNLAAAGHEVTGFDVMPAAVETARAAGLAVAESGTDAATGADVVITMFQTGAQVLGMNLGSFLPGSNGDPRVLAAIIGNAGSLMVFRIGAQDVPIFLPQLETVSAGDLINLPNHRAYMRLLLDGQRTRLYGKDLEDFVESWGLRARGTEMVRSGEWYW